MTDQTDPAPLEDLRVTELGQLLAGPFCGQLLGDFGAEVIKVEEPGQGDPMRQWGREKPHGMSLWWPVVARNKKSVTVNLRDPRGQDLVRRLAERSEVRRGHSVRCLLRQAARHRRQRAAGSSLEHESGVN